MEAYLYRKNSPVRRNFKKAIELNKLKPPKKEKLLNFVKRQGESETQAKERKAFILI